MSDDDLWWSYDLNESLGDANADMSVKEIVVNAELVKTADGQLLAVARLPDLSLGQKLAEFRQTFRAPEKSPLDVAIDQIKSGVITSSDLLDVRKYMLPFAAQTLMNSDVLMTGLLDKFKSGMEPSKATKELAQAERAAVRGPSERPSWRQSEKDVGNANPQYEAQKSFKDSQEVPYGTKGSIRPDYYKPGSTIEVKNYDVSTLSGRNRLVDNISEQVVQRYENLPQGTGQKAVIDVRGQNITNDVLRDISNSIVNRTGGNVEIEFLR